jgi:16S rRNA processing protein RimM
VGTVREVVHGPGGELLVLARPDLPDALVPFVRAIVPTVDVPGGRVVLTPPPGLLEL